MSQSSSAVNKVSIGIIVSHSVVRQALSSLINTSEQFYITGEADSEDKIAEMIKAYSPSMVLVQPDAYNLISSKSVRIVKALSPQCKVAVLGIPGKTVEDADITIAQNLLWPECLISLQRLIGASEKPTYVKRNGRSRAIAPGTPESLSALSSREREVFYLLANGVPNRTIAKQLFVSPRTIETHRARVIRKLGLNSTSSLIRYAIRHNLLSA